MVDLKSALRREAKARRAKAAAALGKGFQKAAADKFFEAIEVQARDVVGSYWSIGDEADPYAVEHALHDKGIAMALPVIAGDGPLIYRRYKPGDELKDGKFGTREPLAGSPAVTPTIVLVPLLAFDRRGHRLGYGKGYYDKTLAQLRAKGAVTAVGFAYAAQEMNSLPAEATDQRLDFVITEKEALDFRKKSLRLLFIGNRALRLRVAENAAKQLLLLGLTV